MCLLLSLLLVPRPAQAQWSVTDQNGNYLGLNSDGSYTFMGAVAANGGFQYKWDASTRSV